MSPAIKQLPQQIATFTLNGEIFGIDVLKVQEVMTQLPISHVPRAPFYVRGLINVRGLIVTCIDTKKRLGIEHTEKYIDQHHIIIKDGENLICISVDDVGDVMSTAGLGFAECPPTIDSKLRSYVTGIFKGDSVLITFLNATLLVQA